MQSLTSHPSLLVAVAIVAVALAVTCLISAPVPTDVVAVGGVSCCDGGVDASDGRSGVAARAAVEAPDSAARMVSWV